MSDESLGHAARIPNERPKPVEDVPVEPAPQREVQSAIRKLAEHRPEKIFEMLTLAGVGTGNPLHQKMEPQHITQVLDLAAKHDEREFELHKTKGNQCSL